MSDQKRTTEVFKCLKHGLDKKLQYGIQPLALKHLQQAYDMARDPAPLDAPWPQITAYRLAHLKMREGSRTNWEEVDRLLEEAAKDDILGPAPLVYRLIAHWKRHSGNAPSRELEELYEKTRRLISQTRLGNKSSSPRYLGDSRTLQPDWLNLLEIAVYATGLDYESITGWNNVDKDLFTGLGFKSSGWIVVEEGSKIDFLYPEPIARWKFEKRCQQLPEFISIELFAAHDVKVVHHPFGEKASEKMKRTACFDLKALLTESDNPSLIDLNDGTSLGDRRRQRKLRLYEALQEIVPELEQPAFSAWWNNPCPAERPACLPPIIMLMKAS